MNPPRLELRECHRHWGTRTAVNGVSFVIPPGQRVALAGPSGSGKSTLLRLLSGSLKPSSGRVLADGGALGEMSPRQLRRHRSRCGIVHQSSLLVGPLSVHKNVTAGRLANWPWWRTAISSIVPLERERTRKLLDQVGLADRQWDKASILSGGQQQRVAIARALASNPTLILADEPTASLDPTTAREVVELLLTSAPEASLVICTHWTSLVLEHVDRIIGIRDGRVTLDRASSDVTESDLLALYAGSRELR